MSSSKIRITALCFCLMSFVGCQQQPSVEKKEDALVIDINQTQSSVIVSLDKNSTNDDIPIITDKNTTSLAGDVDSALHHFSTVRSIKIFSHPKIRKMVEEDTRRYLEKFTKNNRMKGILVQSEDWKYGDIVRSYFYDKHGETVASFDILIDDINSEDELYVIVDEISREIRDTVEKYDNEKNSCSCEKSQDTNSSQ